MSVYVSLKGRRIYHRRDCRCLKNLSSNEIADDTQTHLMKLGFRPCKICMGSLMERVDKEVDILNSYREDTIRYYRQGREILVSTDVGFWKIVRIDGMYQLYHGNVYPVTYYPNHQVNVQSSYHLQTGLSKDVAKDLRKVIDYIVKHDKFRLDELMNIKKLPKKTKKQRSYYQHMRSKRASYDHCKALQIMDKLSTRRNS